MSGYDAEFSLSDRFAIGLWNPAHFEKDEGNEDKTRKTHATGQYGADVLLSLWVYRTNKDETVRAVATQLSDQLDKQIDDVLDQLKSSWQQLQEEKNAQDAIEARIKLNGVAHDLVAFQIAEGKGCPIVYKLVRAFVTFDQAIALLSESYGHGLVNQKDYYERRKMLAKPLRRFLQESTTFIKRFHAKRKEQRV